MNTDELRSFIFNMKELLGYKEIYIIPNDTFYYPYNPKIINSNQEYFQKMKKVDSEIYKNYCYRILESTFNIESLKIIYTSKPSKFNIRRKSHNKKDINILIIPISLININNFSNCFKNEIHGKNILSIEFISRLKISQEFIDNEYIKEIELLGHKFYQYLGIDELQLCEITYDRLIIKNIESIKSKRFLRFPVFTKKDMHEYKSFTVKKISFEDVQEEFNDT